MKCASCEEAVDPEDHWVVESHPYCDECFEDLRHDPRYADMIVEIQEDQIVEKPKHYTSHPSGIECITIVENMDFCLGNSFKYMFRRKSKSTVPVNLKKARYYVRRKLAGGSLASLPAETPVRGIIRRTSSGGGDPAAALAALEAQGRVLDSAAASKPGTDVRTPDGSGDVLRSPASFGAGTAPVGRSIGLPSSESGVPDSGGRSPEEECAETRAEIRRIAHVYQSEEPGYREAMLLVWAVSRPSTALHLALEVMSGLK